MDNITHSLVGVALADLAMGRRATKALRPLFVGAGIVAANLPDIDLAYSSITPAPVGYLLHHRGHTHTNAGLVVLGLALVLAYWFFPSLQKLRGPVRVRFWLLIAIALASHLALDALNNYGIHPYYPVDNKWYFGDSLFILEPALWLILGVTVAASARSPTARLAVALPLLVVLGALAVTGMVPLESVAALAIVTAALGWFALRVSPATRAACAFLLCGLLAGGLARTSHLARSAAMDALRPEVAGRVIDVALTPNPSSPFCWSVIVVEVRDRQDEYVVWRGTLSLASQWRPPAACALQRVFGGPEARLIGGGRFAVSDEIHQPLARLRALARDDCWVRAWLRFGRVPVIESGWIYDLRFGLRRGDNFSHMQLVSREKCPSHVPGWEMPRADLLRTGTGTRNPGSVTSR